MKQINYQVPRRQGLNPSMNSELEAPNGSLAPEIPREERNYKLSHFPKEFNKKYIRSSDWRFLTILILSFILHAVGIYYLFKHLPNMDDTEFIIRIQNQFASRFLSDQPPASEKSPERDVRSDLLTSAREWAGEVAEEPATITETVRDLTGVLVRDRHPSAESSSFESREATRDNLADLRRRNLEALRDDVQKIGLLGIINSGSGLISTELVEDVLAHADTAALHLKEKIENVSSLRVPRPGIDYFGQGLGADDNIYLPERKVRSQRTTVPGVNPTDLIATLTQPEEHRVEENTNYEDVSGVPVVFAGLRTRPKKKFARRNVEQIRETVMGHNPAIQDCYRLALKTNPDLRGKVTVRITVSPEGRVTYAEIVSSTMNLPSLEYCIIEKIRRWNDFGVVDDVQGHVTFRHTYVFGD